MQETPTRRRGRRSVITLPIYRMGRPPANKGKTYPAEVLTREEVRRLMAACGRGPAGVRNRALLAVLYRAGLRVSEALALERKDVDLAAGTLTVLHGKGDKRRVVGIDPEACALLELWIARRAKLGLRGPLFCTITAGNAGHAINAAYVREAMKRLARRAGIEKRVHPHGLRHTHASELMREGVPLTMIRRQLGHSNLAITARYVEHLSPQEVVDAIRARPAWTA